MPPDWPEQAPAEGKSPGALRLPPPPAPPYCLWYKLRGWMMVPLLLGVFLWPWPEVRLDALLAPLGAAIFVLGALLRLWSQMHLHHRLAVGMRLTVTGPYRHVRNPMYIGNILLLVGLCFLARLAWLSPLVVAYGVLGYSFVVWHEEFMLDRQYGEPYREYRRRVPRWWPRLRAAREYAAGDSRAFLWPSVRRELHNLLLLLIPLARLVLLWLVGERG